MERWENSMWVLHPRWLTDEIDRNRVGVSVDCGCGGSAAAAAAVAAAAAGNTLADGTMGAHSTR